LATLVIGLLVGDGGPAGSPAGRGTLLRRVHYTYYATGHASNVTIKDEWTGTGDPAAEYARYHDLALYYANNGNLCWR